MGWLFVVETRLELVPSVWCIPWMPQQDTSMLSFENERYAGRKAIMAKLCNGVFFKKIQHVPKTLDVQPSGANGLMIMCTGELKVDEETNPLKYGQMFHLLPTDNTMKRFWLHNDIFRLNYC